MSLGYDATFELNEFNQPKLKSDMELAKDVILYILYSRPGEYPSLPHIGLDIEQVLYSFYDELSIDDLKRKIIEQCGALDIYLTNDSIKIAKRVYKNVPTLLIYISGNALYPIGTSKSTGASDRTGYVIGLTLDDLGNLVTDEAIV